MNEFSLALVIIISMVQSVTPSYYGDDGEESWEDPMIPTMPPSSYGDGEASAGEDPIATMSPSYYGGKSEGDPTVKRYIYLATPLAAVACIATAVVLTFMYTFFFSKCGSGKRTLALRILALGIMFPLTCMISSSIWNIFYYQHDAFSDRYISTIIWNLKFAHLGNTVVIGLLVLAMAFIWLCWSRCFANHDNLRHKFVAATMIGTILATTFIFIANRLKISYGNDSDDEYYYYYHDYYDFSLSMVITRYQTVEVGWDLAICSVLCFTLFVAKKCQELQNDDTYVITSTNIYQELNRPLVEVLATLFAQVFLFTIYTVPLDERRDAKQEIDDMFYITSVVTLLAYISKEDPLKQAKDSALFWAKVYSVKSDEKLFVRMRMWILFIGDVYVNQYMLVFLLVCLPFQASVDDKGDAVSFVLNLVAIFYVIGMDDLKEDQEPIDLKRPYSKVPNTNDCDSVEKEQAPPDIRNDGDDLEMVWGAHDLSHQF